MKLNKSIHTRDSDSFTRKTLQSYKDSYLEILDYYKSKNIDNDEESFIDLEIRLIKEFIKPVLENKKTELELKCGLDFEIEFEVKPYIASYNKILSFLETKKSELEKNTKPEMAKKDFKDFFKENISTTTIQAIQKKFRELDGKKMAYVIFLLHKEFEIINYSTNSRVESRKHLVCALNEKENTNIMAGINKCFNLNDVTLLSNDYSKDNDYTTIKTDIQTILNTIAHH